MGQTKSCEPLFMGVGDVHAPGVYQYDVAVTCGPHTTSTVVDGFGLLKP